MYKRLNKANKTAMTTKGTGIGSGRRKNSGMKKLRLYLVNNKARKLSNPSEKQTHTHPERKLVNLCSSVVSKTMQSLSDENGKIRERILTRDTRRNLSRNPPSPGCNFVEVCFTS